MYILDWKWALTLPSLQLLHHACLVQYLSLSLSMLKVMTWLWLDNQDPISNPHCWYQSITEYLLVLRQKYDMTIPMDTGSEGVNSPSVCLLPLLCCCSYCLEKNHRNGQPSWPRLQQTFPRKQHPSPQVKESDSVLFTDGDYVIM